MGRYPNAACPNDVPWHRVINAQGSASSRAGPVVAIARGRRAVFIRGKLSLEEHQWLGLDQASKPKQHSLF